MDATPLYSPAQQRVIDLLGRGTDEPAPPPAGIAEELRAELDARLAEVADRIPEGETLWVGKSPLATFNSCEGRWRFEQSHPFAWSVPSVRGTVAHKAIELQLHWRGDADPGRMVDEAVERLVTDDDSSPGGFLRTLTTVELAELRNEAVSLVTAFEECFPPLRSRWRPVVDGRLRVDCCDGRIVLSGKPDLTLGRATDAGKVIIDLKTGGRSHHHVDDLRFYALLDTLRIGLPPRRLATVYLDSGVPVVEAVTSGVLEAATERVVRSVEAMVEIRSGDREPGLRPGRLCSWCLGLPDCPTGEAWLADDAAHDRDPWADQR